MLVLNKIGLWFKNLFVTVDDNEPKLKKLVKSKGFEGVTASVLSAVLGLFVGLIIMYFVSPENAWRAFTKLLQGALGGTSSLRGLGNTLYYAMPLIMTGLSVGFAFKTGLFNIGATGQFAMGMFFSLMTAHVFHGGWVVCMLAGILGGMIWGFIPGIFKALLNVNEVITSIMSNYIGMYLIDTIILDVKPIKAIVYTETYGRTIPVPDLANLPTWGLDKLFPRSNASAGFFIAVIVAIIVLIVLNKTTLGYELKACGTNKFGAKYAGVNETRTIILSMVIAGGLAGLGGALQIQAGANTYYSPVNALRTEGFTGIAVALLATSNPIGTIFAALFFSHLQQGGLQMQAYGLSRDIIDIIIGVIIYFSAFALIIRSLIPRFVGAIKDKLKKNVTKEDVDNVGGEN